MQGSLLFSEAATDWSFFGTFSLGIGLLIFSKTPSKRKKGPGVGPGPRNGLSGEQFWRNHICRTIEIHLLP
jgi:hypothetical protein